MLILVLHQKLLSLYQMCNWYYQFKIILLQVVHFRLIFFITRVIAVLNEILTNYKSLSNERNQVNFRFNFFGHGDDYFYLAARC